MAVVLYALIWTCIETVRVDGDSMQNTLQNGDFLIASKISYMVGNPARGDIVILQPPHTCDATSADYIKRVVGLPGDRLRIEDGQVYVNGALLEEPYATFEPAPPNQFRDNFPARVYTNPEVDPDWWRQMQSLTHNGELVVPEGQYFVLGDNRNHSEDSRFWGFVPRQAIVARPLVIYFSISRPSTTDVQPVAQQASDDRLGHERELAVRFYGFARWNRIFRIVH